MTGEDIAIQCSFESRMASAGTIARLVRTKAIEAVPASYRITETGRNMIATNTNEPETEQPKKSKRKSKKEPLSEPKTSQGEEQSSP
jgi:hypothetical protein